MCTLYLGQSHSISAVNRTGQSAGQRAGKSGGCHQWNNRVGPPALAVGVLLNSIQDGQTRPAVNRTGQSAGQHAGKSGGCHQRNDRVGTPALEVGCL